MPVEIESAIANARAIRRGDAIAPPTCMANISRRCAIGDPQTSSERWFEALAAHGILGEDGWLAANTQLLVMGDYFDYRVAERDDGRVEGVLILGWLAAHARDQVTILFGNHDAVRVIEFASIDDDRFRAAADLATRIVALPRADRESAEIELLGRYPEVATAGYAARDFNAFTVEQRTLVQRLLMDGRFDLATTATVRGVPVLATHAGITKRELGYSCVRDHRPATLAEALNDRLAGAVRQVEAAWRAGDAAALSLAPLHVPGAGGAEGGGLLYHRPSDPERPGADPVWETGADSRAPRRFDPRTALPRGLAQLVGHTGHTKACREMARWLADGTDTERGGLRTLRVDHTGTATYARGIAPAGPRDAVLYMIDPEMHYVATPADVALLELDL